MGSGVGTSAGTLGSADSDSAFGKWMSDETKKENIDESGDEVNSFLERISKKYK
jgi:hypothetical protein